MFPLNAELAATSVMSGPGPVLSQYGLEVRGITLIRDKGKQKVWQVTTPEGVWALKKIPGSAARAEFIASSIRHLEQAGAGVSALAPTLKGEDVAVYDNENYLLLEWLDGQQPDYRQHLREIMQSMAYFHQAASGFKGLPEDGGIGHLGGWPSIYEQEATALQRIKEHLSSREATRLSRLFFEHVDYFIERIRLVQGLLGQSCYASWVNVFSRQGGLCHHDFTPKNLRLQPDGRTRIMASDLVTVDLPARDLRQIFNKVIKKYKPRDPLVLQRMESYYQEVKPLTPEQWEVVYIDLFFPHLFCEAVNGYLRKDWPENRHAAKLAVIINTEREKEEILADRISIGDG